VAEMTRARLAAMSDDELLAYERERHVTVPRAGQEGASHRPEVLAPEGAQGEGRAGGRGPRHRHRRACRSTR
jgi:hypothetical protein